LADGKTGYWGTIGMGKKKGGFPCFLFAGTLRQQERPDSASLKKNGIE
jgi:hypothetical protein